MLMDDVGADTKVIYRRYASLFFICAISPNDNELVTLEVIHRYVEVLDRYFGNVSIISTGFEAGVVIVLIPCEGLRARPHIQLPKSLRRSYHSLG